MLITAVWALVFAAAAATITFTLNRAFMLRANRLSGYSQGSTFTATLAVSFGPMFLFLKVYKLLGVAEGHVGGVVIILTLVTVSSMVYGLISGSTAPRGGPEDDDKRS